MVRSPLRSVRRRQREHGSSGSPVKVSREIEVCCTGHRSHVVVERQ